MDNYFSYLSDRIDITEIRTVEYHDSISSTNDRIKELLKQPVLPKLPCLVIANRQTAGRGRGNKVWWSGDGALLMSLGFELSACSLNRSHLPSFSLAVGRAAVETIRNRLPEKNCVGLHLPNDVYVDGKKICGILIESPTPQHLILGIGINVNNRLTEVPLEFRNEFIERPITSLIEILGEPTHLPDLIVDFLVRLRNILKPV
jgi:BirA family biotin operon repressor/biotin-[acetyl-CoA-carboxylase] ligase